ncbi:MAG: hypothetical protein ACE366_00915 [Bradymonadia bacterium]
MPNSTQRFVRAPRASSFALTVLLSALGLSACGDSSSGSSGGQSGSDMGAGGAGGTGGAMDCVPGAATCACASDGTCATGLQCELGFCVPETPPECDPGQSGCACVDDNCAAGLSCVDALCVPSGCEPGTADCVCAEGSCNGGLDCVDGICGMSEPPPTDALSVTGTDIRGCDLVLTEGAVPVRSVAFADGLVAEWLRQDGKVALVFVGLGGAPINNVGALVLSNAQVATAADIGIDALRCYDANGQQVGDAQLVFE